MNCQRCGSDRVLRMSGKCSDMCHVRYKDQEYCGHVPYGIKPVGGGDYIDVDVCLECGQTQGEFPQPDPEMDD